MGFWRRLLCMDSTNESQVDSREVPEGHVYKLHLIRAWVYKVHLIRAMDGDTKKEAQKILEEVARQLQPIMIKHKLLVILLSEFRDEGLWGENAGDEIKLNLRISDTEDDFRPFEDIVDTMLHELCHIVYPHHDADFHKLLDQLREEYEELANRGITTASPKEYFDLRGRSLPRSSRSYFSNIFRSFFLSKNKVKATET